ncbi:MAG: CoA transferase [Rhodospirillales bacterium]|nr:CoA transferase [Rhodospirillales bacterium]
MGPMAGVILADMGAEVIKIEPAPNGDETRRLKGFGTGFFPYYNRNKKSLVVNLKSDDGRRILEQLIGTADVLIENFAPGTVERLGFGWERVRDINPRLVYCSLKGFMPGPYEKRPALDEVCQMMGGLAYMTGPRGRPLRAGASIIDVMGGSYGVIGILTALLDRQSTGRGQFVKATLFESVAMLMAQHMIVLPLTGDAAPPMPERGRSWSVYDLFETVDREQVFLGITSDRHWTRFCEVFGFGDLFADHRLDTNQGRVEQREWFLPELKKRLAALPRDEIMRKAEEACIPFAQVARPEDLFEDEHLNQSGGLDELVLPNGTAAKLPKLPLRVGNYDFAFRSAPPELGKGSRGLLESLDFSEEQISSWCRDGVLGPVC